MRTRSDRLVLGLVTGRRVGHGTCAAAATPGACRHEVGASELVPLNAPLLDSCTTGVFSPTYDFKVVRVYTRGVATQVIEGHIERDRSHQPGEHHAVRVCYAPISTPSSHSAVSIAVHLAGPDPTTCADHAHNVLPEPAPYQPVVHRWNQGSSKYVTQIGQRRQVLCRSFDSFEMHAEVV